MKPIDHLVFNQDRLSVRCRQCGAWIEGKVHCTGSDIEMRCWCPEHCPPCNPEAPVERTGPVAGMSGEQEGLF